jgi:hypothetical protein
MRHTPPAAPAAPRRHRLPTLAAVLLLGGCIVVPRTAEVYDPQCRTMVRQVVLETAVIGTIGHCSNDGCAVMLASMGIVSAASAVVSGSVAIIGNILYTGPSAAASARRNRRLRPHPRRRRHRACARSRRWCAA